MVKKVEEDSAPTCMCKVNPATPEPLECAQGQPQSASLLHTELKQVPTTPWHQRRLSVHFCAWQHSNLYHLSRMMIAYQNLSHSVPGFFKWTMISRTETSTSNENLNNMPWFCVLTLNTLNHCQVRAPVHDCILLFRLEQCTQPSLHHNVHIAHLLLCNNTPTRNLRDILQMLQNHTFSQVFTNINNSVCAKRTAYLLHVYKKVLK